MMAAALTLAAMTLGELLGPAAAQHADLRITDLVMNSRQATPGAAFVAVRGHRTHGLEFAAEARAGGAVMVLYEPDPAYPEVPAPSLAVPGLRSELGTLAAKFFGRAAPPAELAAVTGTNGKTTIAHLIAQGMTLSGMPCSYIGTLGFGAIGALETHELTTPDCLTLHRELALMGTPLAALEASSHALEQDRIAGLDIRVGLFSNLTRDHLDHHGDLTRYAAAKARLFSLPCLQTAVINVDDAFGGELAARLAPSLERIRVSLRASSDAELGGALTSHGLDGIELALSGRYGSASLRSKLVGGFNAENLLLALGGLLAFDLPFAESVARLGECTPPPGRMEVLGGGASPWVVVDYAHTPAALERVLLTLQAMAHGSVWCVFGCGGERDRGKRPIMGATAARLADHVVLTDDNPRHEDPAAIVADIRAGIDAGARIEIEHSRRNAITRSVQRAAPGDVVLIAGKGHEAFQIMADQRRPLADRLVANEALRGRA